MTAKYTFSIYDSVSDLPALWDDLAATNIFLSTRYLKALERSAPENMVCHYIAILEGEKLAGIAISQFLDLNQLESFGERDRCLKTSVRNFIFKQFSSHVLFIGNNMLTGQNALILAGDAYKVGVYQAIKSAADALKDIFYNGGKKIHLLALKDFDKPETSDLRKAGYLDFFEFSTQPNMVLEIDKAWTVFDDYLTALSKKYRDQYKRSRKRAGGVSKRKMRLEDIIAHEETINTLYRHVARNAPFNTFFLAKNHFRLLKEQLKEDFLFYGYFIDNALIGFNTLIKNGDTLDTYFLGYDENIQREKMLYLNMLYDMITFSINKGFGKIVFARTALEIKSSVGARPLKMYGLMQHSNPFINKRLEKVFDFLEPKTVWQQRHPFKENALVG